MLQTKSPDSAGNSHNYMPQLDSLRTFAVFGVLISHWVPQIDYIQAGQSGVILFFVLSGFLISQILLKSRDYDELNGVTKMHSAKQFYIRRILRIFPVYYITLMVLYYINFQTTRENILWYLTYTSNILYFINNAWGGLLAHTWTLAVEEQFYIIWPFAMLFIPRKYLLRSIIAIIFIAPVFRAVMYSHYLSTGESYLLTALTPACMDAFGLGALLAYFRRENKNAFEFKTLYSKLFMIFTVIFLVLLFDSSGILFKLVGGLINYEIFQQFFYKLLLAVIALYLVSKASLGFKNGFLKAIFENKVMRYLGKISYGMYLFHPFIHLIYKKAGLPKISNAYIEFCAWTILLIIISSFSWYLIEKPINSLKKYFAYE